ncbi:helix-turn-helix transcriptional regulator [Bacillus sp. DJP31]|uniref:helix-turn-helix transcriptional regulator n=1 Tax=Bacillus sp. DJP31 TaxID=3409789 RepID=UPI003BB4D3EE
MNRDRLLTIIEALERNTYKDHGMTISQIEDYLNNQEINAGLKGIRNDLNFLESKDGLRKINSYRQSQRTEKFYWLEEHLFELHELRLLMDAISAARFISEGTTKKIIVKLKSLTSDQLAEKLENELVNCETKFDAPYFADNIQTVHEAIRQGRVLTFCYGRYNVRKEFVLSGELKHPKIYQVFPYGVLWSQEYYYLIAADEKKKKLIHYRIDRMRVVEIGDEKFVPDPSFNLYNYRSKLFHMYAGEEQSIEVEFDNHLINVVIDRFGTGANIKKISDSRFRLITPAIVSDGLVRWLLTWGSDARAIYPSNLVNRMREEAVKFNEVYNGKT